MSAADIVLAAAERRRGRPPGASAPLFVALDDAGAVCEVLRRSSLPALRLSSCCGHPDAPPSRDALADKLRAAGGECLLLGAGEDALLRGDDGILRMLRDLRTASGGPGPIILCRGVRNVLRRMAAEDPKFAERQCVLAEDGAPGGDDLPEIRVVPEGLHVPDVRILEGFQVLLAALEDGQQGPLHVRTALPLAGARALSAYGGFRERHPGFAVAEDRLPDARWAEMLEDPGKEDADRPFGWRSYVAALEGRERNAWMIRAAGMAADAAGWEDALLTGFLDLDPAAADFAELKRARRELLGPILEKDAGRAGRHAAASRRLGANRIPFLDGAILAEREEILLALGQGRRPGDELPEDDARLAQARAAWPDLDAYLAEEGFDSVPDAELRGILRDHFAAYRRQKACDMLPASFLARVEELAKDRPHCNRLETRGAVLERLGKEGDHLLWADALGAEFAPCIRRWAGEMGMDCDIRFARAELPTITRLNRDFFDAWDAERRTSVKDLDAIGHDPDARPRPRPDGERDPSIHLERQLRAVRAILERARAVVAGGGGVILTSDHGSSRPAVLHFGAGRTWPAADAEHSGRCGRMPENGEMPPCAAEGGDGFWSLAGYDHFQGGSRRGPEAHGGAAPEEVVVPVIRLAPASGAGFEARLIGGEDGFVAGADGTEIRLFCRPEPAHPVLRIDGADLPMRREGPNQFVAGTGIRAAGTWRAVILDGGRPLAAIEVRTRGAAASIRRENDDFFDQEGK